MKAVVLEEFGGPQVLQHKEIAIPAMGPGQALVKVHATGVNPADWKMREGYLAQAFTHQFPVVPGWEMAGTIENIDDKVSGFSVGDKIYCYNRLDVIQHGTFAEYSLANVNMLAAMPGNIDYATASTIPLTALTAWQVLVEVADLKVDETVLITAGAGGVGGFAIQIAKYIGAKVCATASEHNHEYLRSLGADAVIDYRTEDIDKAVHDFSVDGVDVVFDCTGSEDVRINFDYVRKSSGRVVTINGLLDTVPVLDECGKLYRVKSSLHFVEPNGEQLSKITKLIESGKILPLPVETYPLEQVNTALQLSQEGHVRGKLALIID
jgi:NADPH:quinone reductase-like Zn-dependent oxidoreductase